MQASAVLSKEPDANLARVCAVIALRQIACPHAFQLCWNVGRCSHVVTCLELQSLVVVDRQHHRFGAEWFNHAIIGVYEQGNLFFVVLPVAAVASTSCCRRVYVVISVKFTVPPPIDVYQTIFVITIIQKGVVATLNVCGATHRQLVVDGLNKLASRQNVLFDLAHRAVIIVAQRIPQIVFVTLSAINAISCFS